MVYSDPLKQRNAIKEYRAKIRTDIDFLLTKADDFWSHVSMPLTQGVPDRARCWEWKGKTVRSNGGLMGCWNDITASRIAIEIDTKTLLPEGSKAKRTCDFSLCVNPAHLLIEQNWIHNGKCISCGVEYHNKPLSTCVEMRHKV